jgi:transposase
LEVSTKDSIEQERIRAVRRFHHGESAEFICVSLGRSAVWLYKWLKRHSAGGDDWYVSQSTRPHQSERTPHEVEEIVKLIRLNLYNQDLFCGAQAILWELEDLGVKPLPSLRTINRILSRNELTYRRTGKYEAKGTPYPKLPAIRPNLDSSSRSGRSVLPERPVALLRPQCG